MLLGEAYQVLTVGFTALCFYEEVLGTFLLVLVILAMTDKQNSRTTTFSLPLALFLLLVAVGGSLGMQTGFALNPARDLGPRLLCWFVGYGRKVWDYRSQYWLYAPVIGPMVGGILGALTYDLLLYTEDDNIIYKILSKAQPEKGGSRDRLNLAENGESGNRAF
ncbi:hypothetical protein FRC12_010307 [Ceratobasidium sp. 428]|nr:hypothetical protein FRC12_010307 [Ceratobasidium sp. 428]